MKRKPKHFIPNIITLANMFLGFLAIGLILKGDPLKAGVFVMIASMLDVFDGKIARMLGIASRFGMEFDSMADTVSFCVVPSILVYSLYVDGLHPLVGLLIAFMPLMFGTIRLAKYNINQDSGVTKSYTEGLTTPIAAITLFAYLYYNQELQGDYGDPRTALMLVAAISVLMVSPIHFVKFPLLSFSSGRNNSILLVLFLLSVIGILLFRGLFLLPVALLFIGWNIIHWLTHSQKTNIQSKIKDQILITENITSVEMINKAGDVVDPLSGLSGDYINFSELDAPSDVTYIDVNHGFIQVSDKVAFFQGNEDAYYNSIIGSKNVDVISGDVQGVSIHYAGFEGDDIFLGGHDDVIDYGLEERMQEFFNSYYDRPGVTVKLGDVNTPTLNELIQNTTDINTTNIDAMISGTAKDTFGDTDIIEGVTKVSGTSSSDVLIGSKEGDELVGGRGDDFIYGQAGADVLTGGQGSDVFYYDISEKEYGADIIKDFNLLSDKLFIGGFDENLTDDSLAIMSGEEMFGEGWQDLGDSLYKDYVVGIEKLSGDFDAILYLEDVNYSTEEVNLLLKDILSDVAA